MKNTQVFMLLIQKAPPSESLHIKLDFGTLKRCEANINKSIVRYSD